MSFLEVNKKKILFSSEEGKFSVRTSEVGEGEKESRMSVIDLLTRVDAICKKYDRYDVDRQKDLNVSGDDAFARLFAAVESEIEAALQVRDH